MTSTLQEIDNPKARDASGGAQTYPIPNKHVRKWVEEMVTLCQPDKIYVCNGSHQEASELFDRGVRDGIFTRLNQEKWPGCYYHRSNPNDVARSEHLTFICTPSEDMAGATNNWMQDKAAYAKLREIHARKTHAAGVKSTVSVGPIIRRGPTAIEACDDPLSSPPIAARKSRSANATRHAHHGHRID